MWLRQSTASQEVLLGPFLDSTDGNTAETGLTIANTDIKLWKEGATTEANKNSGGATHIASGRYYAVLDATDSNTLGKLEVNVHVSGALAVRREFMVVPAMVYDSLILGTDRFDANVTHVADTAQTANDNGADINALISDGYPARFTTIETLIGDIGSGSAGISVIAGSSVEAVAGTPTNTYAVTDQLDGIYHIVPDLTNNTDFYYEFDIGVNGVPIEVEWVGYAQANNATYNVYFYNWTTLAWNQVGFITGTTGATEQKHTYTATVDHVGTGGDDGTVRFRFLSTDGANLGTDFIVCDYAVVDSTSIAAILTDTGTTIPATIATAQADLDTITGADGAALASTQQSITFQPIIVTAGDAINNITLAGSGTSDGIAFTRTGSGDPFDANFIGQINATVDTALTDYDAATGTEAAAIKADTAAILVDTAEIGAAGAGLTEAGGTGDQLTAVPWNAAWDTEVQSECADALTAYGASTVTTAQVNAEVADVLKTDTISEMAQGAPTATPTFEEAVMYLYMALRNKVDVTATTKEFHNDAGTVIWKKALSDDGTTYSEAEGVSGP